MPFKKTGQPTQVKKIFCGCGAEIVGGKCVRCAKEQVPKPVRTTEKPNSQVN